MSARLVKQEGRLPPPTLPASPFPLDLDGVLCQVNSAFNPLHRDFMLDFHVSGARDGYVYLSIALPEGMTRVFVSLLESLHGFARFMDIKARSAAAQNKASAVDPAELQRRENVQAEFNREVCSLYDGFLDQGCTSKEAVRMTNSALKAKSHPWATDEDNFEGSEGCRKISEEKGPSIGKSQREGRAADRSARRPGFRAVWLPCLWMGREKVPRRR